MTELEAYKAMLDGAKDACHHLRAEITQLRAENERLRDALRAVVITGGKIIKYDYGYKTYDPIAIAKEALK